MSKFTLQYEFYTRLLHDSKYGIEEVASERLYTLVGSDARVPAYRRLWDVVEAPVELQVRDSVLEQLKEELGE